MRRRPNALINRRNYKDTRRYLEYCREVRQNGRSTLNFIRTSTTHMLNWATSVRFPDAPALRPTLPRYLEEQGASHDYRDKLLMYARAFFEYGQRHWPRRYDKVDGDWVDSLRARGEPGAIKKRELYTLDEIRAITSLAPRSLAEERIIAAVAFLFLSGMRVSAFASLPLRAIDWAYDPVRVRQDPQWGVRTKYKKGAFTYLLATPELENLRLIAKAWHRKVLEAVGDLGMYYAILVPRGGFDPVQVPGKRRDGNVRDYLEIICERAGVNYLPPHVLRHSHIVYTVQRCESMADLKAVSQNVMHESLQTTDAIYSELTDTGVAEKIKNLGRGSEKMNLDNLPSMSREEVVEALADALFQRQNPD
jgi:integrase